MTSEISHAFSLVLYYLARILSVDDLGTFEYLILVGAGADFYKFWCSEKQVRVGCGVTMTS